MVDKLGTVHTTQFYSWVNKWDIVHTMSSAGKDEAAVKTVKHTMYKCLQDGTDVYETLLELSRTLASVLHS